MAPDREKTPALFQLLCVERGGKPFGCSECPFAKDPRDVNAADPDEGTYACQLLSVDVWGEEPKCTEIQWQAQALLELSRLSVNGEGRE